MNDLEERVAFITGGANGIGLSIATSLAREGVAVALADIDSTAAQHAQEKIEASGGRALAVPCDVTDVDSLARAADLTGEAFGPVHILVNNAGAFRSGAVADSKREDWEWLLEINLLGVVNGIHTFLPRMRAHDQGGHILNTASISGHVAVPGLGIYTATKFAVVGLSETLRVELAAESIDVSVLCPGIVQTGLLESSSRLRPERFGGPIPEEEEGALSEVIEAGTDPVEIGERVVTAIRTGEFYIFTHPPLRVLVERRADEILAAY